MPAYKINTSETPGRMDADNVREVTGEPSVATCDIDRALAQLVAARFRVVLIEETNPYAEGSQ